MVLGHMVKLNVKPDFWTYSIIIRNFKEDDILECPKDFQKLGDPANNVLYLELIYYVFSRYGWLLRAREVVDSHAQNDKNISRTELAEIRTELIRTFPVNGRVTEAVSLYNEYDHHGVIFQQNKATLCLVENLQSKGESRSLEYLLKTLQGTRYRDRVCQMVISYIRCSLPAHMVGISFTLLAFERIFYIANI